MQKAGFSRRGSYILQGKGVMRTYWLAGKIKGGLYNDSCLPGDSRYTFTNLNCEPDSKQNSHVAYDMKRNSVQYTSSAKQKQSAEEMKSFSCSEINGYNPYEINVNLRDDSPLGQTVRVTPPPAPDLLPKVRFETKM